MSRPRSAPNRRNCDDSDRKARDPGVFRRAHQHGELSGVGPGHASRAPSSTRCSTSITAAARPRSSRPTPSSRRRRPRASRIAWVLETHAHADHLSGAPYIKLKTGAKVGIGEHIRDVQRIFRPVFNATDVSGDGSRVRPPVQGRRALQDRRPGGRGDLHARPHAGLRLLQDRRRGVRRRHHVHAGLRHRARGFPGRRCARAVPLDQAHPRPAAGDAAVHVPRLQGARPRPLRLGDDGGGGAGEATSTCTRA